MSSDLSGALVLPLQNAASQLSHSALQATLREVTHQQRHF